MNAEAVVAIVVTLDTKGAEAAFVREWIERLGERALLVDTGILGEPGAAANVSAAEVVAEAGTTLEALRAAGDRGEAVAAMGRGAAAILTRLHTEGRLLAVLGLGGSGGTSIAAAAMQSLPLGMPKLIVSTVASGDVSRYVGIKDVAMMYSVVDIAGVNRLSRQVLSNAAGAIAGMARAHRERHQVPRAARDRPIIAATMFGVTTPCVTRAREWLEAEGFEVLVFHATGTGGRAMESLVDEGYVDGVLDVTTTEWADEVAGGVLTAGSERLEAMGRRGIPHVVAPGALDMVNFGPRDTVPANLAGRLFYQHNPQITLMRTTVEENREMGWRIAEKLSLRRYPVEVFLPLGGVSAIDRPNQPFWDPEADAAFRESLRANLRPEIPVHERTEHINDDWFALAMARRLAEMVRAHIGVKYRSSEVAR
jgi:uncharacterized protein (UPF0261 family)